MCYVAITDDFLSLISFFGSDGGTYSTYIRREAMS